MRSQCEGASSPRGMGEGQGRGQCPLVLAFRVSPAHTENIWGIREPLAGLGIALPSGQAGG